MRVRNKKTGQMFDVLPGTRLPDIYEEIKPIADMEKGKLVQDPPVVKEEPVDDIIEEVTAVEPPKKAKKTTKKKKSTTRKKKGAKNDK